MDWYWWLALTGAGLFSGVVSFYIITVHELREKISSLEASHPFNWDCNEQSSLINNPDPMAELIFRHVISCLQCINVLKRDIGKIDTLRISNNHKKILKSLLEPIKLKMPPGQK